MSNRPVIPPHTEKREESCDQNISFLFQGPGTTHTQDFTYS
jgi:hypothetical protein